MFSPPIFYFFLIYIFRWGAFHYWVALLSGKVEFNFQTSFRGNILNMSTCCCAIRLLFLPSLYCESSVVTTLPLLLICKREVFPKKLRRLYSDFFLPGNLLNLSSFILYLFVCTEVITQFTNGCLPLRLCKFPLQICNFSFGLAPVYDRYSLCQSRTKSIGYPFWDLLFNDDVIKNI